MRTERARRLIQDYDFQLRRMLKQEVNDLFASIEKMSGSPDSAKCFESINAEPKIPPSAYFLFASRMKMQWEAESDSPHLLAHRIQAAWKQISSKDRKEYEREALNQKAVYEKQRADFKERGHYNVGNDDESSSIFSRSR